LSSSLFDSIIDCHVVACSTNPSSHCSVEVQLELSLIPDSNADVPLPKNRPLWHKVSNENISKYQYELDKILDFSDVNNSIIACKDVNCKDKHHLDYINSFCDAINDACYSAGLKSFPYSNNHKAGIPFWNENVQPLRDTSIFWHDIWIECGKPQHGVVYDIMRDCRSKYHLAIKKVKEQETTLRKSKFISSIVDNKQRDFWQEVKKQNKSLKTVSCTVDNKHTAEGICQLFADKYDALYSSATTEAEVISNIKANVSGQCANNGSLYNVTLDDVETAIRKLNSDKNDGYMKVYSNHYINGSRKLKICLSILFNMMLYHGYSPATMLKSVIVSIPKNNRASMSDSNNYRGIALCNPMCKIMDNVLLHKFSNIFQTSNYQYAFKRGSSTSICTAMVKETVQYYNSKGSGVHACLLDASKAFDRINFGKLFSIMIKKSLPAIVIRMLIDLYTRQELFVSWAGSYSRPIYPQNGVKQGAILSPILFCMYIDELFCHLSSAPYGCRMGNRYLGAMGYADDVILLSPTRKGLQSMINICKLFGDEYCITFNDKKTMYVHFSTSKINKFAKIYLDGKEIKYCDNAKYLGSIISENMSDLSDINYKKGLFTQSVNRLFANFGYLQSSVLHKLFQSYCTSHYACHLWDFASNNVQTMYTCWNKAVRRIWKLPYRTHTKYLYSTVNKYSLGDQLICRFVKLFKSMITNKNDIVKYIADRATKYTNGTLGCNLIYISQKLNCSLQCILNSTFHKYLHNQLYLKDVLTCNIGNTIRELCDIRDNEAITNLSSSEIEELIEFVCVN
jgi:hypothetical protein